MRIQFIYLGQRTVQGYLRVRIFSECSSSFSSFCSMTVWSVITSRSVLNILDLLRRVKNSEQALNKVLGAGGGGEMERQQEDNKSSLGVASEI